MKRTRIFSTVFLLLVALLISYPHDSGSQQGDSGDKTSPFGLTSSGSQQGGSNDKTPPFGLTSLTHIPARDKSGRALHDPRDPYAIFINYELGMHCVGFDISYCCIIPPYNSVQAQALRILLDNRVT